MTILEGPAGIGKTRLLDEAVRIGERLGAPSWRATAAAGHRVVPMGVLLNAVLDPREPMLSGTAADRATAPTGDAYWLIQELESSLEQHAAAGPMMILIDDLHWADGGTVAAIEILFGRLRELPIAWMVALRADEASEELSSMLDRMSSSGALRLRLSPLDEEAVAQLVTDISGAPPDDELERLAARAGGVPFWLSELLIALREDGRIEHADGRAVVREGAVPGRTSETVRRRLEQMTPEARELVSVASVLGPRFTVDSVQRMLQVTAPGLLLSPVEELLRSGVLVEEGEALAFRHDLLREGVLATLPRSVRQSFERQAVDVLLESGAPPAEVAFQLADSARPGDREALEILLRAIDALRGFDPAAAAELAGRTLALTPRDDPRHARLVADTAVLLHAAGRVDDAVRFADTELGQLLPAAEESEVRFVISNMFGLSADIRAEANRRALALGELDAPDRARHEASLIHNILASGRSIEVRQVLRQVGDDIRANGDDAALFTLALAEGGVRYTEARFAESLELIEGAGRAAVEAGAHARAMLAEQWRCELLGMLDRLDEATIICDRCLAASQRESQAWAVQLWEQWRGRQVYVLGNYPDAIAMLEETFAPGQMRLGFGANHASALAALAGAALHIGDRATMRHCGEIAEGALMTATPELRRHARWVLARLSMADEDASLAHRYLVDQAAELAEGESVLPSFPADATDVPDLVRIALAADDAPLAERAAAMAEERAEANPGIASIEGASWHASGLLAEDAVALIRAIEAYERSPRRPALASALEDAAIAELRAGHDREAVELLTRALEQTIAMDARWDSNRVRRRLRRLGVRRRMVAHEPPAVGWESLTPSELAVVRAITAGMTNRAAAEALFLSPHTVGSHLRHVFAKLNINSRVELARLAGEQLD